MNDRPPDWSGIARSPAFRALLASRLDPLLPLRSSSSHSISHHRASRRTRPFSTDQRSDPRSRCRGRRGVCCALTSLGVCHCLWYYRTNDEARRPAQRLETTRPSGRRSVRRRRLGDATPGYGGRTAEDRPLDRLPSAPHRIGNLSQWGYQRELPRVREAGSCAPVWN